MLTGKIKRENLKSFVHRGQDDRSTPRLRHDDAPAWKNEWNTPDEPKSRAQEIREAEQRYIASDHCPKEEFDPEHTNFGY